MENCIFFVECKLQLLLKSSGKYVYVRVGKETCTEASYVPKAFNFIFRCILVTLYSKNNKNITSKSMWLT